MLIKTLTALNGFVARIGLGTQSTAKNTTALMETSSPMLLVLELYMAGPGKEVVAMSKAFGAQVAQLKGVMGDIKATSLCDFNTFGKNVINIQEQKNSWSNSMSRWVFGGKTYTDEQYQNWAKWCSMLTKVNVRPQQLVERPREASFWDKITRTTRRTMVEGTHIPVDYFEQRAAL